MPKSTAILITVFTPSMYSQYANRNSHSARCSRAARSVCHSSRQPAAMPPAPAVAPVPSAAAHAPLSRTPSNSGKVNSAHQIATLRNAQRTACASEARPNQPGCSTISTLIRNNRPPPT